MRRLLVVLVALIAVGVLAAVTALAGPPQTSGAHFMSTTAGVSSDGALVVSWDEAGVGTSNIHYTLTADAEAVYACVNGGGNHPKAANKETENGDVSGGADVEPKHGRATGSITAGPIGSGDFSCPAGQRLVLASVTYSNIILTDTQNNVTADLGSVTRTFFAI